MKNSLYVDVKITTFDQGLIHSVLELKQNIIMKKYLLFIGILFGFFVSSYSQVQIYGASGIVDGTEYNTIKGAFDAINATSNQTGKDVEIRINASTTETFRATLNDKNWNSLVLYPTVSGIVVTDDGSFNDAIIRLDGVRNVVLDGRVNKTGTTASLSIINNSSGGGAVAVDLLNSSQYNTIQYCKLQSQLGDNSRGILFIGTSSAGEGNSYNLIQYNEISGISATQRPRHAVVSRGTSGRDNLYNEISNNKIFNFINNSSSSSGIILISGSDYFTIKNNSFYETVVDFEPQYGYDYSAIRINTNSVHYIENNYIGGNAPEAVGTWSMKGKEDAGKIVANFSFTGIYATGKTDEATVVKNNTIRGFHMTTGGASSYHDTWDGMFLQAGNIDVIDNIIGSPTGTASIFVEATNGGLLATSHGILNNSSGLINIVGNTIGALEIKGAIDYSHSFESIYLRGSSGITHITDNFFGSTSTPNSINVSGAATNSTQKQDNYGVYSASQNETHIKRNTIANLHNAYNGTITSSKTRGIRVLYGSNYIEDNIVYNISSTSNQAAGINSNASVIGIELTASSAGTVQIVRGNTVYNLNANNASSNAVSATGIYFYGPTNATKNIIERNFIHGINSNSTSNNTLLIGILLHQGNNIVFNNIVSLGSTVTSGYRLYAVWDDGRSTNNNNIYFNTLSILGNANGSTSVCAALWNQSNSSTADYRNNIFANKRTVNSIGNDNLYAIRLAGTNNLTIDYNNYWSEGNRIGIVNPGYLRVGLAQWRIATGQDANSLGIDPAFQNTSTNWTSSYDFLTDDVLVLPGISIAVVTQDYDLITRLSVPKMGAFESNNYVWYGTVSTDFNNASNWAASGTGIVPPNGADVTFAPNPLNNCHLDQARSLRNININVSGTGAKAFVLNGNKLTLTGALNFSNGATLNAKASGSVLELAGTSAQTLPLSSIVDNEFAGLELNNEFGFSQNANYAIKESFVLSKGVYSIGAHTLTIDGSVLQTIGTLNGGSTSNIVFGGSGLATILPEVDLQNLTINRSNGINMVGNVSVAGTLALTSGVLSTQANVLTISGNSPTGTGSVNASNTSAELIFDNSSAITLLSTFFGANAVHNLTISGNGGVTSSADFTVNGVLNLQAANPSGTKGSLDMFNSGDVTDERKTLVMGQTATTLGIGDVTGKIKRNTIAANTVYSFGSSLSTIVFTGGVATELPSSLTFIVKIGEEHPVGASVVGISFVKRYYEVIKSGGSAPTRFNLNLRYLDSELNGNAKSNMVFWDHHITYDGISPHEHGVSFHNTNDNFMALASHSIGYLVDNEYDSVHDVVFGELGDPGANYSKIWLLANRKTPSGDSVFTWIGPYTGETYDNDWMYDNNWADNVSPTSAISGLLNDGSTPTTVVAANKHYIYITNSPSHAIMPDSDVEAHSIFIEEGGKLEARTGKNLDVQYLRIFEGGTLQADDNLITVKGAINPNNGNVSWNNVGSFIAGTSTVIFTNANAAAAGNTDFYNLSVNDGAKLSMINGSRIGIENSINLNTSGALNTTFFGNTIVDYNGAAQNVINPENNEYSALILSGSSAKTLPVGLSKVLRNFELEGTASATGTNGLTIGGELKIAEGTTFASGNFNHVLEGNFENNGTFTPSTSYEMSFAGTTIQNIFGTTKTAFANLNINNLANVQMQKSVDVNGELKLTAGSLIVGIDTLGINGTVSGSAKIDLDVSSSLSFSGNTYTLPDNIFDAIPVIQNVIVNKTSGQSIVPGNQDFTILNELTLTSGILDVSSNKMTINGDILRASGVMKSNATTELVFNENENLLEIPDGLFANSDGVGILTIHRAGGIKLGNQDVLISGKLILSEGLLSTNSNFVVFGNTSSVGTTALNDIPGSISSYINGCTRKIGNTAFTYPIGSDNEYAPIGISAAEGVGVNSDSFDACYFYTNPNALYNISQLDGVLNHVSNVEYWTLGRSNGTTNNVYVTLSWDDRSGTMTDLDQLVVAHWNNIDAKWESKGASSVSGNIERGTISSENFISAFSPFTLGSLTRANILPVSMLAFEAVCDNNQYYLWWQTATETNNAYFDIEESVDGKSWQRIGAVSGAGNSNSLLEYRYESEKLAEGNLYRLKQVDFDGEFEYYGPVAMECKSKDQIEFKIFPNPAMDFITVQSSTLFESLKYDIFSASGQLVKSGQISNEDKKINLMELDEGIYWIQIENGFSDRFVVLKK